MMKMISRAACLVVALLATTPASAGWSRAVSPHFVIYSDQSAEELKAYATKLEAFDQAVRYARRVPDVQIGPASKVTVYAVRDLPTLQRIYGGYGVGGFYIRRAGYSAAFVPLQTNPATRLDLTPENVFFHEYAHHLMYENVHAALPLWLSEGFAEFFSTVKFEADGSVGLGAPAAHRAEILLMKLASPMPLDRMLGGTWKQLRHYYLEEIYGRGWLLTHYLTFNTARKGQLERYVAGIQEGKPALQAARDAFGDLGRLDGELKDYVRSKRFPYVTVPPQKFSVGAITVEPLSPGEAAFMEVRMHSRRGVTEEQAAKLIPHARRIAANYPDDPAVQAGLAEAEADAHNYDAAVAAADRALAANPKSMDALLEKGRAISTKAEKDKSFKPDWKEVRQLYLSANRLDPDDPRPLIGYHGTFGKAGLKPTASALEGLLYAFELSPQDPDLRWTVMRELVAAGRQADAAKTLKPLAYAPHGGKAVERANDVLDKIEAGDLSAAEQRIAEIEKEVKDEEEREKKKRK
jgi:tetratricopeptide (TPR) repeat protein